MNLSAIISLVLSILLAIIFLVIVAFNKTCHTIPMMLLSNSCLAELVYGSNMLSIAVITLEHDTKQIVSHDKLCALRDYVGYVGTALLLYSFTLQATYRYIIVVYPARISWQLIHVQGILIFASWIFPVLALLPWLFMGSAIYDVDNQACILPFQLSIPIIYGVSLVYLIPIILIILIYFRLVRYVHQISTQTTSSTLTIFQARRHLAMVKRVIMIISILLIYGVPYTVFMFMSFVTRPPRYHYRISIMCADVSQTLIMLALFKFSRPVMDVLTRFKHVLASRTHSTSI